MRRAWLAVAFAACVTMGPPAAAVPPVPYHEIVDSVQLLAAEVLGRKKSEINTVDSLFAQGMSERQIDALVVAVQNEFGVVLPVDEIQQAMWNDATARFSVRRLANLVEKQMRLAPPI